MMQEQKRMSDEARENLKIRKISNSTHWTIPQYRHHCEHFQFVVQMEISIIQFNIREIVKENWILKGKN